MSEDRLKLETRTVDEYQARIVANMKARAKAELEAWCRAMEAVMAELRKVSTAMDDAGKSFRELGAASAELNEEA